MKRLLLPLVFLIIAGAVFGDSKQPYRTFTDEQGRTLRAVVVRTGPGEVWIRRDDGQTFRLSRTILIEADRKYIEEWEQATALSAPNAFEFAVRRYTEERERTSTESKRTTTERSGYIVTITNNTTLDLKNLEVEFRYYALRGELDRTGQNRRMEPHRGSARIASLPARGKEEIKTGSIALTSTSLKPDWSYVNTNKRRTEDSLGGVWVRIRQEGKVIAEYSSPSRLKESESWD